LFAFSNADNAHRHARVLDAHDKSYNHVLVCSMSDYLRVLKQIAIGTAATRLDSRDFAVLQFNSKEYLFAELDELSLEYKEIEVDTPGKINYRDFVSILERLRRCERGSLDTTAMILRWQEGYWKDKEKWAHTLKQMFNERESDVFHLVLIQVEGRSEGEVREMFARMKRDLLFGTPDDPRPLQREYGIKEVWFGRRCRYEVRDPLHRGSLRMSSTQIPHQYALVIKFDNEEHLLRFHEDKAHALIRRRLYEFFDFRFKILYEGSQQGPLAAEEGKRALGDFIEAMAERYVSRVDFQNDELIHQMLLTNEPYPF
jgi:hypothetical protein